MDVNAPAQDTTDQTFCYRHPTIETGLRCNTCDRYICAKCALRTPVGYRCPECLNKQQDIFFNITPTTYAIAAAVAFALALPAVYIFSRFGLLILIILGIPAGGVLSEIIHRVLRKQRGRYTWLIVGLAVLAGGLVVTGVIGWPLISQLITVPAERLRAAGIDSSAIISVLADKLLAPLLITAILAVTAGARFRYGK